MKSTTYRMFLAQTALLIFGTTQALAQTEPAKPQRSEKSLRYGVNQTFNGRTFEKDNNVWVYTKEFADLFGMPTEFIEDLQGAEAAAFRIEDTSYQLCGFGGDAEKCQKVEQCMIDLYFDEDKTPLPWATDKKSEWLPWYSSLRWLRWKGPNPARIAERPLGIIPNTSSRGAIAPFADPASKQQAIFTSNIGTDRGGDEDITGSHAISGYTRQVYKNLTLINLQLGCIIDQPKIVNIRLDARHQVADPAIACLNRIRLPEGFVQRIKEQLKVQRERNQVFYRSLFPPPLGTRGTVPDASQPK